jgi:hypothetical protein
MELHGSRVGGFRIYDAAFAAWLQFAFLTAVALSPAMIRESRRETGN